MSFYKAYSCSASDKTPRALWNLKVPYSLQSCLPLDLVQWQFFNTPTSYVIKNQFNTVQPAYSGTKRNRFFFSCWQVPFVTGTWSFDPRNTGSSELQIFPLKTGFRYVQVHCKKGFTILSLRLLLVVLGDLSLSGFPLKIFELFFISPVCAVSLSVSPCFAWMCQKKYAAFWSLLSH